MRLIYYTIFFGNVKKKTAQKSKKIVKKVDKFWDLEYNSERRKQAVGESGLQPGSYRRQRRRTHMKKQKVSDAVIHRLPRYYRYLDELHNKGVVRISSNSLGQKMDITASQIRQDLSCFGEFGQQGYGYNVAELRSEIGHILGIDSGYRLIVVGAGHLGHALLQNFDFQKVGFQVDTAFDVSPALIGTKIDVYKRQDMGRPHSPLRRPPPSRPIFPGQDSPLCGYAPASCTADPPAQQLAQSSGNPPYARCV